MAVLTGGSRGIGRSSVLNLAARGVHVIFTYTSGTAAEEVAAEAGRYARVTALPLDVTKVDTFDAFADRVRAELAELGTGRFDYLVNNAGAWYTGTLAETTVEDFDRRYAVNVRGLFFITQKLVPLTASSVTTPNTASGSGEITALGRPANPEEIGPIVATLLSDDNGWINGDRIEASGGMKL